MTERERSAKWRHRAVLGIMLVFAAFVVLVVAIVFDTWAADLGIPSVW